MENKWRLRILANFAAKIKEQYCRLNLLKEKINNHLLLEFQFEKEKLKFSNPRGFLMIVYAHIFML